MNSKKQSEILLKEIERIYERYPDMQDRIHFVMVEVCREENISPKKVFLLLFIITHYF